jgi:hypothetical protein
MTEIPPRMRSLERDRRGLPVPFIVFHDDAGIPHFTINDTVKRSFVVMNDLCGICGQALTRGRWFCGGPMSALLPQGAYIDPPMHYECMAYALQVCPYLALPNYSKEIGARTVKPENNVRAVVFEDPTVFNDKIPVFVAIMVTGQKMDSDGHLFPKRPPMRTEYWQHGKHLGDAQGEALAWAYINERVTA